MISRVARRTIGHVAARLSTTFRVASAPSLGVASLSTNAPTNLTADSQITSHDKNIIVLGGSGYVGSEICRQAVHRGHQVTAVSRSGKPASLQDVPWAHKVKWVKGDVFEPESWAHRVNTDAVVVSSVGVLGSPATMERMIGDANVAASEAAAEHGARKFVLISASPLNEPALDKSKKLPYFGSYVNAKERAELSVVEHFSAGAPQTSTETRATDDFALIRPGFIFGTKGGLPLHLVGIPMRLVFSTLKLYKIPVVGPIFFEPPVAVTEVAKAAVACCESAGKSDSSTSGPIKTDDIMFLARAVNHTA